MPAPTTKRLLKSGVLLLPSHNTHPLGMLATLPYHNIIIHVTKRLVFVNLASASVPAVILLAFRFGILASARVPAVILLAFKFGILASATVPLCKLLAFKLVKLAPEPLKVPAVTVFEDALYVN